VDSIFEALCHCASLHPDNVDNDDDDDDAFIDADPAQFEAFTGEPGQELSEVGRVRSDFLNDSRYAPY
jgi:nucleotide-sensitive chloride channel 1A